MHEKIRQCVQVALDADLYVHVWSSLGKSWYRPGDTAPEAKYHSYYACHGARYHELTKDMEAVPKIC
jgi:hypothetical protein